MFLDPEPKRRQPTMSAASAQQPRQPVATSARDIARLRRQPLHERSKSQVNEQRVAREARKSTVRLVDPTPSPTQSQERDETRTISDDGVDGRVYMGFPARASLAATSMSSVPEASVSWSRISAASGSPSVSETDLTTNETTTFDGPPSMTLLSNASTQELASPIWHRRSTSSGNYSQSSTLHGSEIALSKKSLKNERLSGLSQFSTLRGTPSPYEHENRERAEKERLSGVGPSESLPTLQEVSPERRPARLSTIRPVSPSDTSSPSKRHSAVQSSESQSSESSPSSRPRTNTLPSFLDPPLSVPARTSSRRHNSTGSIPSSPVLLNNTPDIAAPSSSPNERPESRAIPGGAFGLPSSPNFIAYTPDSIRPISGDPLRNAPSIDSINSRLQFGSTARPGTGRSLATESSWDSPRSHDTLPPLHIPKKRLRHKSGSESLSSLASSSRGASAMSDDDIDTMPYPKVPFSSHLSTIASESEGDRSRTASQHLSHFSLGSGVLTGDDASSLPLSPKHRRNDSAPAHSLSLSTGTRGTVSSEFDENAGDMTLGIFREESAVPQPLFNAKPTAIDTTRRYEGPLPPIPPIPPNIESDENMDTLSALKAPPLRQQRSGKSLRSRSNTTPGHSRQQSEVSYVDSERFSSGSSIFPTWARHFYSGSAVLASKASFGSLSQASKGPGMHQRNQSSVTERSITSRLGAGLDNGEPSPTSSHFLPAIFRSRTRKRTSSPPRSSRSSKIRRSGRSRPSQDRPSEDSMAIRPLPPAHGESDHSPEVLPSGQPKWGKLKGSPESHQRPLPRKYSKQRQWDDMSFPRPMTKDRLSDSDPHLMPSKRTSQSRLSAWQAPSFVSGLDTLITSRCNRQILLFMLGFVCPLTWMLAAVLPLPDKPTSQRDLEKQTFEGSEEDVQIAMLKHEAGDAERRWREERAYLKARWWRMLNRIMSVVGALVIGAVIALVVVATT